MPEGAEDLEHVMEEGEQVMSEVHLGCSSRNASVLSSFTIVSSPLSDDNEGKIYSFGEGDPAERNFCGGKDGTLGANNMNPYNTAEKSFMHEQPSAVSENDASVDESGDLLIPRRNSRWMHNVESHKHTISIYHHVKTCIPYVGLQIWKASLLLGDFLLHKMQTTIELDDVIGLELGAGTGLLGILLAAKARLVFLTDLNVDILDNCFRNVLLNSRKSKSILGTLRIRQLDWQEPWPPSAGCIDVETSTNNPSLQYSWLESDMEELEKVSIILAADVIYSDALTDAFFSLLEKLMPSGSKKVLWLALEKRINFSLSELDVVAHGYHHFRSFLEDRTEAKVCEIPAVGKSFAGKQLQLHQIPQYLLEYERTNDLELWEVWRN